MKAVATKPPLFVPGSRGPMPPPSGPLCRCGHHRDDGGHTGHDGEGCCADCDCPTFTPVAKAAPRPKRPPAPVVGGEPAPSPAEAARGATKRLPPAREAAPTGIVAPAPAWSRLSGDGTGFVVRGFPCGCLLWPSGEVQRGRGGGCEDTHRPKAVAAP